MHQTSVSMARGPGRVFGGGQGGRSTRTPVPGPFAGARPTHFPFPKPPGGGGQPSSELGPNPLPLGRLIPAPGPIPPPSNWSNRSLPGRRGVQTSCPARGFPIQRRLETLPWFHGVRKPLPGTAAIVVNDVLLQAKRLILNKLRWIYHTFARDNTRQDCFMCGISCQSPNR